MTRIAIIGAGLSGLTVAQQLKDHAEITIFEKSTSVGGRISARTNSTFKFDHGAQFFRAKNKHFLSFLKPLIECGVIKRWDARFVEINGKVIEYKSQWNEEFPHYVGAPRMNSFLEVLASQIDIKFGQTVKFLQNKVDAWGLFDEEGTHLGNYDWVLSSVPPWQTKHIFPKDFEFLQTLNSVNMSACFTVMLGFHEPLELEFDAALIKNNDISWISLNSSKPGRDSAPAILIHSSNDWADAHITKDLKEIESHLSNAFFEIVNLSFLDVRFVDSKLWRYANASKRIGEKAFIDRYRKLGACGDWCVQGKVEAAFLSGQALATELLDII